jgi:hypothetical protein
VDHREHFGTFPLPSDPGNVRQILGRPGEVWGVESAADQLVVIRQVPEPGTTLPGDMDCDEDVDFDDIDDFVAILTASNAAGIQIVPEAGTRALLCFGVGFVASWRWGLGFFLTRAE